MTQTPNDDERLETFAVQATSESATHTVVTTRDFEFAVDEPEELGGTNVAPNPVEYILGALAGCINVVGHTVAQEMDMAIDDIEIEIEGDLDPAKFLGADPEPRAGYQNVRVDVTVETDADESTVATWLESVRERCPVSDTIANETPIDFSFGIN